MKSCIVLFIFLLASCGHAEPYTYQRFIMDDSTKKYNSLTPEEKYVIEHKGTEMPFSGKYDSFYDEGTYVCKKCNAKLYSSDSKFNSGCGWPSFDDNIAHAVLEIPDADGRRTEIVCSNCGGHLGHVFRGEGITQKNTRHCVNSVSLDFLPAQQKKYDTAIFASGCFWGTQYFMQKAEGVVSTSVGYIGGHVQFPSYEDVCSGLTGHAEAVRVVYDSSVVSFEELTRLFFETHDPTQVNGQGPDIGDQYRSEIFYTSEEQKKIAEKLKNLLVSKGYRVATNITQATMFWNAEDYHQDYYMKKKAKPYCHFFQKRF